MMTEEEIKWNERLKDREKHPQIRCGQPWFKWRWKRWLGTRMITKEEDEERWNMELKAEFETDGDLTKSIPQLVCDFNFEKQKALKKDVSMEAKLSLAAQGRMVAMMAQVAMKNETLTKQIRFLTTTTPVN
jgi:hypothetical protein